MMLLVLALILLVSSQARLEIVEPGPESGIVLKEQPGLLITNCRWHTHKIFVRFRPDAVCRKHVPLTAKLTSWAAVTWTMDAISHAEADIVHMLTQMQKFTVTQSELSGAGHRDKRFIAGLLTAASAIGSLFSLGVSAVNAVNLATLKRHMTELRNEIPQIQGQLDIQHSQLQTIGRTLQGTVVVLNTHSETLKNLTRAVNKLLTVVTVDYAHIQLVTTLMADMNRDIGSSIDSLILGRIPPYLVSLELVQELLSEATREQLTPLQAHLAYTLGSSVPIYVDPKARELAFLIHIPVVSPENIYRLKDVINVGIWRGDVHVRMHTPKVIAYHDSDPNLYLAPNLQLCTPTRDIHYLCPSKPFVRDSTGGLCGLKPIHSDTRCPTTVTPRNQMTTTQAEIVGNRWLVLTPVSIATVIYDQHDTSTRVELPWSSIWVDVPNDAMVHVDNLALYHLHPEQYQSEVEISTFFSQHSIELESRTVEQIKYEGSRVIDLGPLDEVLKEMEAYQKPTIQSLSYAWSTADTALVTLVGLGYLLTFGIAYFYFKRTQNLCSQINKCRSRLARGTRRRFAERNTDTNDRSEGSLEMNIRTEPLSPAIFDLVDTL